MRRARKWGVAVAVCATAAVVGALWHVAELSKCKYMESSPAYSADNRFYTQMQMTVCRHHTRSHVRLVMGQRGRQDKAVLLDFGPDIGTVGLSWQAGPELHVQASDSAITRRYGPYEGLPPVVVTSP